MITIGSTLLAKIKKELSAIFDVPKSDIIINVSREIAENAIDNNTVLQTKEEAAIQTTNLQAYANTN